MLTDVDVRQAVEFESPQHPVLSVYLNVDPQQRTVEQYKLALRNLLNKTENAPPDDVKRMQSFVETGFNRQGRGLIMFSCAAENFWSRLGICHMHEAHWAKDIPRNGARCKPTRLYA